MSTYISTILHCSGKNPESSLWLALPPTLTHYNQGGIKSTTPNLERRNVMGSLSVLAFYQHVKIPKKNILWKWALIKQSITWHGGNMAEQTAHLMEVRKQAEKMWKWPGTTYTLQKRHVLGHLLLTWPHFLIAHQLGCKFVSEEEQFPSMQEAVYVIPSNTHAPLQSNQTAKVSTNGVQKQAKYLSAILSQ